MHGVWCLAGLSLTEANHNLEFSLRPRGRPVALERIDQTLERLDMRREDLFSIVCESAEHTEHKDQPYGNRANNPDSFLDERATQLAGSSTITISGDIVDVSRFLTQPAKWAIEGGRAVGGVVNASEAT